MLHQFEFKKYEIVQQMTFIIKYKVRTKNCTKKNTNKRTRK
jgi:hypothetical protein